MSEILVATDSKLLYEQVAAVLETPANTLRWVRSGHDVRDVLVAKGADLTVVDMQIGSMGGLAVAMDIRLESDAGRMSFSPVLVMLDRRADVFLCRRTGVEGWIMKPLDPVRMRRAASALLEGASFFDETDEPNPVAVPPKAPAG
ncbi:MAG: response regulator [Acidimicrobiales bacterium]